MFNVYAMALGSTGIVKVGYTNDLKRRAGEHGRKYNCRGQVEILDSIAFTSKATAEKVEAIVLKAMKDAGFEMVKDAQNGDTERFYMNGEMVEITFKVRKEQKLRVGR
jgi:predicted GIY-YIG superfamily endonuclease